MRVADVCAEGTRHDRLLLVAESWVLIKDVSRGVATYFFNETVEAVRKVGERFRRESSRSEVIDYRGVLAENVVTEGRRYWRESGLQPGKEYPQPTQEFCKAARMFEEDLERMSVA